MDATNKPEKNKIKTVLKFMLYGIVSLIVIFFLVNFFWKISGSNQWELEIDRDGTRVYSLKTPGASIIKFKGVTNYKYTYGHMISSFIDESLTENCVELVANCVEYEFLNSWDPVRLTNSQYWRMRLFFPFDDREMVLNGTLVQDKETKGILLENSAAQNLIPPNDCCVRVTHLHNTWRYTPLDNGEVEIEYIQDFDLGGFFPDILLAFGAEEVYNILHVEIPRLLDNKTEYHDVKLDFLEEY